MPYVLHSWGESPWPIFEGATARLVANGEKMTALLTTWDPRSKSTPHTHPQEQIAFCLEGEMIFTIEGQDWLVQKGDVVRIPGHKVHHQRNEADRVAIFFECFSPIRPDLLRHRFEPERS